ncbi:MAG: hypothetical protein Q7K42_04540, partial [Candidatus Diapherotrites archaeon]|nr:hypothetical protein [Candidatus Diapherotrites archaeon]
VGLIILTLLPGVFAQQAKNPFVLIQNLGKDIVDASITKARNFLINLNSWSINLLGYLVLASPEQSPELKSISEAMISLLGLFYLAILSFVGFKFLLGSINEVHRAEAKQWLVSTIFLIVILYASKDIYSIILEFSKVFVNAVWTPQTFDKFFSTASLQGTSFTVLGIQALTNFLNTIVLFTRYQIVTLGWVLFPLGIFLYFLQPVKHFGALILNIVGVTLVLQALIAIVFWGYAGVDSLALNSLENSVQGNANELSLVSISILWIAIDLLLVFAVFTTVVKTAVSARNSILMSNSINAENRQTIILSK